MKPLILDINCDLGEGLPTDALLMPYLDSCNVACGAHAGDPLLIGKTLALAKTHQVNVGAHPSFPDRVNFGRKVMHMSDSELTESLLEQIKLFERIATSMGLRMHHIKPHGALYNLAAKNPHTAYLITDIVSGHFADCCLYCPPFSEMEKAANEKGIPVMREVFADRNYRMDLSLVERSHSQALIENEVEARAHVAEMVFRHRVKTIEGQFIPIQAETLCIHGDNPNALTILKSIRKITEHEATQGI